MRMRCIFCLLVAVFAFHGTAAAQPQTAPPPAHKELHERHRQWQQEHMFPVLQQWKQELDALLAPEDLEQLNQLRAKATQLRTQRRELHAAMHEAHQTDDDATLDELHTQMEELREQYRSLAEELRPIAEKYREQLHALREQHRPTLEAWKEQWQQQWQQWREQQRAASIQNEEHEHRACRAMHPHKHHRVGMRFLLWDGSPFVEPSAPSAPLQQHNKTNAEQQSSAPSLLQLSPNPAATQVTLQFSLPQAGTTTLTLYDAHGNVVATPIQNQYFQAGIHHVDIATHALASGVYSYTLKNNDAVLVGTLRVVH